MLLDPSQSSIELMLISEWILFSGALLIAGAAFVVWRHTRERHRTLSEALEAETRARRALEHELKRSAVTDPSTALLNRRAFVAQLHRQLGRARRNGKPLTLLMMDIDHFRNVNETYGQSSGDYVLMELAAICREAVRKHDFIGCLGGEEFGILLPNAGVEDAYPIAERIRSTCERRVIRLPSSADFSVTVSIGVAVARPVDTSDSLMARADRAMCAAKKVRNSVVAADSAPPQSRAQQPRRQHAGGERRRESF